MDKKLLPHDDPLGIQEAIMELAGPTLRIEAEIVVRQWNAEKEKAKEEK